MSVFWKNWFHPKLIVVGFDQNYIGGKFFIYSGVIKVPWWYPLWNGRVVTIALIGKKGWCRRAEGYSLNPNISKIRLLGKSQHIIPNLIPAKITKQGLPCWNTEIIARDKDTQHQPEMKT